MEQQGKAGSKGQESCCAELSNPSAQIGGSNTLSVPKWKIIPHGKVPCARCGQHTRSAPALSQPVLLSCSLELTFLLRVRFQLCSSRSLSTLCVSQPPSLATRVYNNTPNTRLSISKACIFPAKDLL